MSIIKAFRKKINTIIPEGEGNGAFRMRRVLYTGLSIFGTKGVNFIVTLIMVPLTYNYLGEERYGLLMTILSFVGVLFFADLGLGFGLQNKLPFYKASEDKDLAKKAISSTFILLLGLAFLLTLFFISSIYFIDWKDLLNVDSYLTKREVYMSFSVFVCFFVFTLPFSIVQKVQNGLQEGYFNEMWRAVGNVLGLLLVLVFIYRHNGVPHMVVAIYGGLSFSLILNFLYRFLIKEKEWLPRPKYFDFNVLKSLLTEGGQFFIIQLVTILTISLDSLIIARYMGTEYVAQYNIGYKLVMLTIIPAIAFISPMLYAFNDAYSKKEFEWVQKTASKTLVYSILVSLVFALFIYFFGNKIIALWIGDSAILSVELIIAFSFFILVYYLDTFFLTIMSSTKFLKYCVIVFPIAAIASFVLKLALIDRYGVSGVIWGTNIGLFILFIIPSFIILKRKNFV